MGEKGAETATAGSDYSKPSLAATESTGKMQVAEGFPVPPQQQPVPSPPQVQACYPPHGWQPVQLQVQCPHCGHAGAGVIKRETGAVAWLSSLALVIVGCWIIACVPLCVGGMKDTVVHCAVCNVELGRRSALSD